MGDVEFELSDRADDVLALCDTFVVRFETRVGLVDVVYDPGEDDRPAPRCVEASKQRASLRCSAAAYLSSQRQTRSGLWLPTARLVAGTAFLQGTADESRRSGFDFAQRH
jgi:hypothetical protein